MILLNCIIRFVIKKKNTDPNTKTHELSYARPRNSFIATSRTHILPECLQHNNFYK